MLASPGCIIGITRIGIAHSLIGTTQVALYAGRLLVEHPFYTRLFNSPHIEPDTPVAKVGNEEHFDCTSS
jgi:hypothetical protein